MGSNESHRKGQRGFTPGFTLVEMLVVIVIIGLLGSILLPVLGSARKRAQRAACGAQLKQIGDGMQIYCNDYKNRLPNLWYKASGTGAGEMRTGTGQWWTELNDATFNDDRVFSCPSGIPVAKPTSNHYENDDWRKLSADGHGFNANQLDYGFNDAFLRDQASRNDVSTPADPSGNYIKYRGLNMYKVKRPSRIIMAADSVADGDLQSNIRQVSEGNPDQERSGRDLGEDAGAGEGDDRISDRHAGLGNIVYLDGHVATGDPTEIHKQRSSAYSYDTSYPTMDNDYDYKPWNPFLK